MATTSFMTAYERQVQLLQKKVCKDFCESVQEHPEFSAWRHIEQISKRYSLTGNGVKKILVRSGIYQINNGKPIITINAQ